MILTAIFFCNAIVEYISIISWFTHALASAYRGVELHGAVVYHARFKALACLWRTGFWTTLVLFIASGTVY